IRYLDLWASSRQVPDTITEFPLFTFWLGDLHPHLLSLPLSLAAIALAAAAGREKLKFPLAVLSSILFGLTWAANPWALPPTFLAIALMLVAGDGRWRWPDREGWPRWVTALAVGAGGWLIAAPFHLAFDPPSRSVRTVFAWTRPTDLLLFAGVLLIPAFFVVFRLMQRWGGPNGLRAQAFAAGVGALTVIDAAATGRPSMVFLCVGVAVLVAAVLEQGDDSDRPALALAALALFLFLVPEMVYLEDGYGEKMHRMNTVFKAYFQGWVLLAAAMPVLVRLGGGSRRGRRVLLALSVAASLPHLLSVGLGAWASPSKGLDGLAWMDEGDRLIVEELRRQGPGISLVEAVGDAYSEYARLSSASGVPAYLGWANHELVWRGPGVLNETGRRQDVIHDLYSLGDPLEIVSIAQENDIGLIAIGFLERRDYCESELDAVREAGVEIIDCGSGGELVVMAEKENLS
ncbi:MAG: DUF2298 domain-containing protein, partial [Thermoanaerobaculales bacterium]|nr:DUF2298 domain-containing protein [Thermoanaerobaculales bacterium]